MKEATMATNAGKQALARVLHAGKLLTNDGAPAEDVADWIWNDFKAAVAEAQAELREEDSAGVRRWQDARHGGGS